MTYRMIENRKSRLPVPGSHLKEIVGKTAVLKEELTAEFKIRNMYKLRIKDHTI